MAKKKTETKKTDVEPKKEKVKVEPFDLQEEINKLNPYIQEGFSRFLLGKTVNDLKTYKEYYKFYMGEEY